MSETDTEVLCRGCGRHLDESPGTALEKREPCPSCGSTTRKVTMVFRDDVAVGDYFSALGQRDGKTLAFRESSRQGRTAAADRHADGSLSFALTGTSPQGEEDTLATCRVLVETLNQAGGNWDQPTEASGVVDCAAADRQDPNETLSIQVVRALVDSSSWRQLNESGKMEREKAGTDELVELLKEAIDSKACNKALPPSIRPGLTLALDATRLPALAFDPVVERFRRDLGSWARKLGFQSIWIVGPVTRLTQRLDVVP